MFYQAIVDAEHSQTAQTHALPSLEECTANHTYKYAIVDANRILKSVDVAITTETTGPKLESILGGSCLRLKAACKSRDDERAPMRVTDRTAKVVVESVINVQYSAPSTGTSDANVEHEVEVVRFGMRVARALFLDSENNVLAEASDATSAYTLADPISALLHVAKQILCSYIETEIDALEDDEKTMFAGHYMHVVGSNPRWNEYCAFLSHADHTIEHCISCCVHRRNQWVEGDEFHHLYFVKRA